MGIYIKGMKMPQRCDECVFLAEGEYKGKRYPCICHAKGFPIKPSETDLRDGLCPLISVPNHGRLIDADMMEKECCPGCENKFHKYENCIDCVVANAPTVIKADKEDET